MPPPTASGHIYGELFKQRSHNFAYSSDATILINLPDMTSLAASDRLQNVIKYCIEVRKTGVAGTDAHNSVTV